MILSSVILPLTTSCQNKTNVIQFPFSLKTNGSPKLSDSLRTVNEFRFQYSVQGIEWSLSEQFGFGRYGDEIVVAFSVYMLS